MQGIAQKILANPGKYSIQELQQGVQNGVIPAYIAIPLIQEKVQQQKQMQMAQVMQQAPAKDQPSIASQVMQEAQGVEALPTSLPQQYAEGGIVAFQTGGSSDKYETPYDRMNRLNRERAAAEQAAREEQARAQGIMPYGEQMSNLGNALLGIPLTAGKHLVGMPGYGLDRLINPQTSPTAPATTPTAADLGPVPGTEGSTSILGGKPTAGSQPSAARPGAGGPGITGLGGAGAPGSGLKAPTFTAPGGESYEASAKRYYEGYGKEAAARDAKLEESVQAERDKIKGQAFDDYKANLEKEALAAGAEKDQAKYMSIFKAGLAMMAGTSRHALENIGKGAMAGAEDYQAAMKDLKKADKERQKELSLIEQARRAEALGDRDTAIRRMDSARDRADARERYTGEGIYKATNLDKGQAYDLAKTQFTNDSDIFRTKLAGEYQLAGHRIGAEATVAAANARANQKEGISTYQLARLRQDAEKQIDQNAIRAQLAQQLKLSKAPKPGADQAFEQRFQQAYEMALMDRVNRALGQGSMGGAQGFQLPQGYKVLGSE